MHEAKPEEFNMQPIVKTQIVLLFPEETLFLLSSIENSTYLSKFILLP
jgi:hypothetical protein